MDRDNTIARLENIAKHAVHTAGEDTFILSLDDGLAIHEAIEALKAQLSQQGTTSDLISRQAVINAIENTNAKMSMPEWDEITNAVMSLPTVQPEPAILVTWIDKYIEWLKSFDNEFANLAAAHISVMVKKWRGGAE